jgi:putative DNA primase/helicase
MGCETDTLTLETFGRRMRETGISSLPVCVSGKNPRLKEWKHLQSTQPTDKELQSWERMASQSRQDFGWGIVAGAVSGNLEVIDFDQQGIAFNDWSEIVNEVAPGLLARLYIERSQRGGIHVAYRCEIPVDGRLMLAYSQGQLTIETRGEGNYCICAPSPGYTTEQGDLLDLPILTASERQVLIHAARALDDTPPEPEWIDDQERQAVKSGHSTGLRPGDDYNQREDIRPLLQRHGWKLIKPGANEYWQRPGKDHGTSATLRGTSFYVFTASTEFQPGKSYSPFGVYAVLEHFGNFKEAARELRKQAYGDASPKAPSGTIATPENDTIALGQCDPDSGKLVLSTTRTLPTAEAFVRDFHQHKDGRTLHFFAGQLLAWQNGRYETIEEAAIRQKLQAWLHNCLTIKSSSRSGGQILVEFASNPRTVSEALASIQDYTHLPESTGNPSWLGEAPHGMDAKHTLACPSMLFHLPRGEFLDPSPLFFSTNVLACNIDENAPEPSQWLTFLDQIFETDNASIELLQEWFGYCLTNDTSQQKMLLIYGHMRGGKGTIGRILRALLGKQNVIGPSTSDMCQQFGLASFVGKSLAVVSDARFRGDHVSTLIERVLSISGEDTITIPRKFLLSITVRLNTRLMFLSNELPNIGEASGALANRFLILKVRQSFLGREDLTLESRLLTELPGILNWAIEGWYRLRERGRFVMPQSSQNALEEMEELASPVTAFVRECCIVEAGQRVKVAELFSVWQRWNTLGGRNSASNVQTFGRDLRAAFPHLETKRGGSEKRSYIGIGIRTSG